MIRLRAICHGDFGSGRVELLWSQSLSALSPVLFTLTHVLITITLEEIFDFYILIHYLRMHFNSKSGYVPLTLLAL